MEPACPFDVEWERRDPTGASTEYVPTAPREFRTKGFFHPGLDLSLPVYI